MKGQQQSIQASGSGESHRIYWQHQNNGRTTSSSRHSITTSSAAVRITPAARARDVTQLLRKSLHLGSSSDADGDVGGQEINEIPSKSEEDSLVLVGTLFSLPKDYVQFEHEQKSISVATSRNVAIARSRSLSPPAPAMTPPRNRSSAQSPPRSGGTSPQSPKSATRPSPSGTGDPFHLVHTLYPDDSPLVVRDRMMRQIQRLLLLQTARKPIISPKLQWFYVPTPTIESSQTTATDQQQKSTRSTAHRHYHNIPNCIHLEGYCTSMEEEDDDEGSETDDGDNEFDNEEGENLGIEENTRSISACSSSDEELLRSKFPWLGSPLSSTGATPSLAKEEAETAAASRNGSPHHRRSRQLRYRRAWKREHRRLHQLCCSSSNNEPAAKGENAAGNTLSGYLLKRSKRDSNVWRRVHCVLSNDYLWFVTRLYSFREQDDGFDDDGGIVDGAPPPICFAKHGRIRLTSALLLEPAMDYAPLFRTPHAFEVVTASGVSHIFRATSKALQTVWMQMISDRILQSFENSLLDNGKLIVADQSLARIRRLEAVSIEPLAERAAATESGEAMSLSCTCRHVGNVLRWGMEVSDYREYCRHVRSILPAKSPVVVSGLGRTSLGRASSSTNASLSNGVSGSSSSLSSMQPPKLQQSRSLSNAVSSKLSLKQVVVPPISPTATSPRTNQPCQEPLDPFVVDMIHGLWQQASHLLERATQVGESMYQPVVSRPSSSNSASSCLNHHHHTRMETLFRHIDFVITGRRRKLSKDRCSAVDTEESQMDHSGHSGNHDDPPPIDLFDTLLTELQSLAVSVDKAAAASSLLQANNE